MVVDSNYGDMEKIYDQHLKVLCGIKFTFREIDVIACILHNRGEKKIASLLAISDRTVSSHVRNIMNKLGCNSRDYIIDFVEKSGKLQHFRKYHFQLVLQSRFEKQLQKIAAVINCSKINCSIDFTKADEKEKNLLQQIEQHLNLANVTLIESKQNLGKNILCHLYIVSNSLPLATNGNNNIALLFDKNSDISTFDKLKLEYIDFTNKSNYYLSVLLLLKKIITKPEINKIIEEFKAEQSLLKNSLERKNIEIATQIFDQDNVIVSRKKAIFIVLILSIAATVGLFTWFFAQKQTTALEIKEQNMTEEWNLPLVLEHYTERPQITKAIWDKFKQDENKYRDGHVQRKTAILVGLHGLGGIGKTTLAKNAIHYPEQHYSFKAWFSAETKDLLQSNYFELGEKYNLFTNDISTKQKIILVKEWLEKQQHILLVYDNVPDMDMLNDYLPNRADIIITSRNNNLLGAIEIGVMTEDEAVKLLDNLIPQLVKQYENYNQDLKKLAKILGYLPLALSQAGAYIAENALTIMEYLSLYSTEKDKLLSDNTMPAMDQHQPAYFSWDISIKKLQQHKNGDKAQEVLNFIACCYPEYIPNKLLAQYFYGKTDNEATVKLNELLTLLKKYSLIKVSSGAVSIHRLVHLWLGSKLSKEKKLELMQKAVEAIKAVYPQRNHTTEDIAFMKLLLLHSETILEQMREVASEIEYSKLLSVLGDIYYILGNFDKSRNVIEELLTINRKFYGENSIETANTMNRLGKVYISFGQDRESQKLLEKALVIQQKHYGLDHIETADTFNHLGRAHSYLGEYKESQDFLEKALAIEQKLYGLEHVEIAHTLNNLGRVYSCLGKYKESQNLLEKALAIEETHYGSEHVATTYTLHYLGKIHASIGKYKESQDFLEKALAIEQNHYGLDHVGTANTLHHLGRLYLSIGKYKESQALLEKSLAIEEKQYGSEHVQVARTLSTLGRLYIYLGKYKEIEKILEKTLEIEQKHYGSEHVQVANTLHTLGILYTYLGKYEESQKLLEKALVIERKYYGLEHIFTACTLESLGSYYLVVGDYDKAKELIETSHDIAIGLYGRDNIFAVKIAANLGNTYRLLNNFQKSKEVLEQALVHMEKLHGYDQITKAKIIANLGLLYSQLGDNKERKKYLEKALVIFKKHLPQDHTYIKQTITNLNAKEDNIINIGYMVILFP